MARKKIYKEVDPVIKITGYKKPSELESVEDYNIIISNKQAMCETLREHIIPYIDVMDIINEKMKIYMSDEANRQCAPNRIYININGCSMCFMFEQFEADEFMPDYYDIVYRFRVAHEAKKKSIL